MIHQYSQEATRAALHFNEVNAFDINLIKDNIEASLSAFGLQRSEETLQDELNLTLIFGPIGVQVSLPEDFECDRIDITVERLRDSETLHPEAETAILAEIMSLLVETLGGEQISWTNTGLMIDAERFVSAFTPLRKRGGTTRVSPRRVRADDRSGTPIIFHQKAPNQPRETPEDITDLKAIFADDDAETEEDPNRVAYLGAWAATATVGVMNPVIGVPLAAYNLRRGADLRVSTHAFALTAALTGIFSNSVGYLPFF